VRTSHYREAHLRPRSDSRARMDPLHRQALLTPEKSQATPRIYTTRAMSCLVSVRCQFRVS
jgi:hypothetical protein